MQYYNHFWNDQIKFHTVENRLLDLTNLDWLSQMHMPYQQIERTGMRVNETARKKRFLFLIFAMRTVQDALRAYI